MTLAKHGLTKGLLGSIAGSLALALGFISTPAYASSSDGFPAPELSYSKPMTSQAYLSFDDGSLDLAATERAAEKKLGVDIVVVESTADVPEPAESKMSIATGQAAATSYPKIYCGGSTAPWGFKLARKWVAAATTPVTEPGMSWWRNYSTMPKQAGHIVPASYQFHGTYNPARNNDKITYSDSFSFRHNIAGGGQAKISISGAHHFVE